MRVPDSFLLDEVRCGFFVPAAVKQAWAAQLEVLMEIDRVCRKHNINYYADWGTLLGTVRHGGFIPWDDDLDIVMKREDYERFMTVARFDMEEGFDVQTFRNQKDFWLFMGKVVGKNHFCFEKDHLRRFHNFPYIACVDIFVLDYMYRDEEKEEQRRTLCKYMLGVADAIVEGTLSDEKQDKCLDTIEEMGGGRIPVFSDPVEMGRYIYGEIEKIFAVVPESEADCLTQLFPWGLKGTGLVFPKEVYSEPIYLPFECTTMPVPRLYDKMLKLRYGDYMKLVKSGGGHNYPFFEGQKENLKKVLDFELPEFKFNKVDLYRSEEEKTYKSLSYKAMGMECIHELMRMKDALRETLSSDIDKVILYIQDSQQLAIDFGTMIEQIWGEGCTLVAMLENYCEKLYALYENLMAVVQSDFSKQANMNIGGYYTALDDILNDVKKEFEQNILNRKAVIFMPVTKSDMKDVSGLVKQAVDAKDCDVYILPLPYYYKDYNGLAKEILCNNEMCTEIMRIQKEEKAEHDCCGCTLLDYKTITEEYLELLHPEVIIVQNPYDEWNPNYSVVPMYYSKNLHKYTDELVYVTPLRCDDFTSESERAYSNMRYYVTMPGVVCTDKVVVQSEQMRLTYIDRLTEFSGEDMRGVWEEKVVVYDLDALGEYNKNEYMNSQGKKKNILYGISIGTYLEDETHAKSKIERSLEILKKYSESIDVSVYYFPEDGKCDVSKYDAYYGDPMPVATEFVQAGKPVMIQNINI